MIVTMVLLLGVGQRFLGPPEKKPEDAGVAEHATADAPVLNPGDDAPLFSGVLHNADAAGMQRIDVSSLVGAEADAEQQKKAVLISFFATWCKPCKKEMPFLEQLYTEYKSKGLQIISVAIDKDEATWPEIGELVKKNHVTYPIVKDRYNLIARQYLGDKTAMPSVFIIDKDGKVVLVKQGYTNDAAEFLKAEVEKALQ
jgi:thiol-disulfide isomerase/thioredoxin